MNENFKETNTAGGINYNGNWYPIQPPASVPYSIYPFWSSSNNNNMENAFKIVQKLMDKKFIKLEKIKDFVDLVNDISEIIN